MLKSSFSPDLIEAGLDEVGRGCLAGPVVAAAVILPKDFALEGLNDSKLLREAQRDLLVPQIKQHALAWAIAEASPAEIDEINIQQASYLAMHRAVDQLALRPELLLVDGNRFRPYPFIAHQCLVKGDRTYANIAAASVLAKDFRDALMRQHARQYPQYGWETNVAYPTPTHLKAIREHGQTPLHRRSFRVK
ncbi:RNase HII [Catalinimonas alkaloidigena]|uniref:Ribonuclease HII n=1 Tax=Catalinimonas alkaloidigena TaxID=1075417 RepID=A0A1G9KA58_9BACT|nr:ribonuclease HII [Catalinimonas alkaloidigena]SDL46621.1 RNase HII [Catalinimonas alkaloidigena]